MAMTVQQKRYACGRIDAMMNSALNGLKEKYFPSPPSRPTLTLGAAITLIKQGKVSLHADVSKTDRMSSYTRLGNVFDFSKYDGFDGKHKAVHSPATQKVHDKAKSKLALECQKVKDNVMLSDSATALNSIQAFEKACQDILK